MKLSARIWYILFAVGLCVINAVSTACAKDAEKKAGPIFEKRFKERKIRGTGHLFRIVINCDSKRLKSMSDILSKDEIRVVEYAFTFHVNTKHKAKARLEGSGLDKAVEGCIIDKYYKDVRFFSGPSVPEKIPERVSFPAVITKGKEPLVPVTPIIVVGPE